MTINPLSYFLSVIIALIILGFWMLKNSGQITLANPVSLPTLSTRASSTSLISKMTVRLLGETVSGSGVVIARNGNQYSVLTCAHVVNSDVEHQGFNILTYDDRLKKVDDQNLIIFKDLDLAIVTFYSSREYPVASLSQAVTSEAGIKTYAAGYPSLIYQEGEWKLTNNMGIDNYFITKGETTLVLSTPLLDGYQLGLSNEVHQGMSGGPVFNNQLELIGIVGRTKYGGNRGFYQFSDGSYPSEDLWEEMEESSWAIPIYPILRKLVRLQMEN